MLTFDFVSAQLKHSQWKTRMHTFLNGSGTMTESEAVSHRDCDLGKWLYSDGTANYGHLPAFQELERIHKDMHAAVKDIVTLKNSGKMDEAHARFNDLTATSDRIIDLLDQMNKTVSAM